MTRLDTTTLTPLFIVIYYTNGEFGGPQNVQKMGKKGQKWKNQIFYTYGHGHEQSEIFNPLVPKVYFSHQGFILSHKAGPPPPIFFFCESSLIHPCRNK